MPIISTDIKLRLSGGVSNTDPNASLGGVKSTTEWSSAIFDNVSSGEGAVGDIEYRCIYVHNSHGSLAMLAPKVWIQSNTPSPDTAVAIGAGTAAVNANEQTVAAEGDAPSGVTFGEPANEGAAIALPDIPAGQHKAVWIRRTVTAGAAAAADGFTLRVKCDTLA